MNSTFRKMVSDKVAQMNDADLQVARYYKYHPNPKPYLLGGEDITEKTIERLKRWGVWDNA